MSERGCHGKCFSSFIDGTVAGTPANMTIAPYKDGTLTNDHSYYGRGCKNGWGTDGDGGSQTPCADSDAGGRYVKTADNETQKNGTYYHFQAATSGTGGALTTQNVNSSDTFCPLGWQMPYSGTGGDYYNKPRSWNYLFTAYSIAFADGTVTDATKIKSYPFSYVYSGNYYWNIGRLYSQSNNGRYWSSTVVSSTNAYNLGTWSSVVRPADTDIKAGGYAIRCVLFLVSGKAFGNADAKISSICVICGPDATTWSASARSPVTTGATKRSAKTSNVGFLPLQVGI